MTAKCKSLVDVVGASAQQGIGQRFHFVFEWYRRKSAEYQSASQTTDPSHEHLNIHFLLNTKTIQN